MLGGRGQSQGTARQGRDHILTCGAGGTVLSVEQAVLSASAQRCDFSQLAGGCTVNICFSPVPGVQPEATAPRRAVPGLFPQLCVSFLGALWDVRGLSRCVHRGGCLQRRDVLNSLRTHIRGGSGRCFSNARCSHSGPEVKKG